MEPRDDDFGVPPLQLLLVEDNDADALLIERTLKAQLPAARLQRAKRLKDAYALLAEASFDLVMSDHKLPDGSSLDLLTHLSEAGLRVPVVVLTRFGREDLAVAAMKAGASDYVRKRTDCEHLHELPLVLLEALHRHHLEAQEEEAAQRREQANLLKTIRSAVATVNHEINNPLAIISGNAQLLVELARAMDLPPEIAGPIQDIDAASQRIATSLRKLANLKEIIPREYVGESELIDLGEG